LSSQSDNTVLLRIRPSLPDQDEVSANRGPLMMETILSSLHSLSGKDAKIGLEVGLAAGKIAFYARTTTNAAALVQSQLYAQYPDAEIDVVDADLFTPKEGETVVSADLTLANPEVFAIKRYPQFSDPTTRQSVDTIAGITSALVRYPQLGMRGHVQVIFEPVGDHFRHRALKFLPFLEKGLSKHWHGYAHLFARAHLARGWSRLAWWPVNMLLGGWRVGLARFSSKTKISLFTGEQTEESSSHEDEAKLSARTHEREDNMSGAVDKLNRLLFQGNVRVSVIAPEAALRDAGLKVQEIASAFRQFTLPQSNGFTVSSVRQHKTLLTGFEERPYILSAEEVASLWHVPNILVKTPNIDWVLSKKLEPPVNLPIPGITDPEDSLTILGESVFQGQRMRFGIRTDDRRRHMYVIGKTGMGKSVLLQNMIFSDIHSGKGIGVIDPHGDLIESILRFIPRERSNDVVLFEPSDRDFPISLNIFECKDPAQQTLVVSGLMSVFMKMWPEAFSGRMEYILRNALLALLEAGGQSMLGILRIFADDAFRAKIMENVTNPVVKTFWEQEYTSWSDKYRTEAIAAIQNKIGQLLSTPLIRNIVGQVVSTLDIRHAMDTGKIVLMNLSKGKLGEDTVKFLGSMLVTKFQLDAMSRADIPEEQRRDFFLYVDEFQNFATKSFAEILSEARKYRLSLVMAHQFVTQLLIQNSDTTLRDAVFGNVGSMLTFQVGSDDAEVLSLQFEEMVSPKDILTLPKYHAYIRLMIDGMPSKPFSVGTLPPPKFEQDEGRVEIIRGLSRERYAMPRGIVEDKIMRWVASAAEGRVNAKSAEKAKEKEEEEMKKARARGMSLDEYRKWRDRELWSNTYNALRKKKILGEPLTPEEETSYPDLEQKLLANGGQLPPLSKTLQEAAAAKGIAIDIPPPVEKPEEKPKKGPKK
jgi:hypothetical protein